MSVWKIFSFNLQYYESAETWDIDTLVSACDCELILNGTFKRFANDLIPQEKSAYLTLNIHRKSGKFGLQYIHPAIEVRKFPRRILYEIVISPKRLNFIQCATLINLWIPWYS